MPLLRFPYKPIRLLALLFSAYCGGCFLSSLVSSLSCKLQAGHGISEIQEQFGRLKFSSGDKKTDGNFLQFIQIYSVILTGSFLRDGLGSARFATLSLLLFMVLVSAFLCVNVVLLLGISGLIVEGYGFELGAIAISSAVLLTLVDGILFDAKDSLHGVSHQIDMTRKASEARRTLSIESASRASGGKKPPSS
ncbi:hypothetical protein GUITHDRAFT_104548 [Guillardia theta CCMP2712]|uniref:Uncharacterized protein n=1 Tax=Guillardia theta (strain CCMP2712) TaxID=905079 RepID=L1JMC0_GUITC|nr:hypothetical protein GUITHDRAFT_104548 [Guillardia theta CCMP2712]EKX49587.1 hypothetical protein GUITHDRAFT_104548 [Guillardia theta CCMP2712]|eukprot:XP_005836567.1 hypothetical protein GUITHDRAFT_104548 [Guillardia theta CCMP2712]